MITAVPISNEYVLQNMYNHVSPLFCASIMVSWLAYGNFFLGVNCQKCMAQYILLTVIDFNKILDVFMEKNRKILL